MKYCLLLLACVAFLSACKESTAPDGSNTIAGLVVLYDSTGFATDSSGVALSGFSGVAITIDGTTRKTLTDRDGHFEFDNLSNGTYNITATKPGFGEYHWFEQLLLNGRIDLPQAGLAQMRQVRPELDLAFQPVYSDKGFYFGVQSPSNIRYPYSYCAFYCDRDSIVTPTAPHLAVLDYLQDEGGEVIFPYNGLRAVGVHSGDTLYFTCSYVHLGADGSYYDPIHHQTRYSSCGPRSNVVMAVMP